MKIFNLKKTCILSDFKSGYLKDLEKRHTEFNSKSHRTNLKGLCETESSSVLRKLYASDNLFIDFTRKTDYSPPQVQLRRSVLQTSKQESPVKSLNPPLILFSLERFTMVALFNFKDCSCLLFFIMFEFK